MDDEGTDVDIDKLRAMGKSVMRIVGDVNLVNQTNNKKFEVPVDIYFYSAYGKEYDFIIYQCGLRIQGTSSRPTRERTTASTSAARRSTALSCM